MAFGQLRSTDSVSQIELLTGLKDRNGKIVTEAMQIAIIVSSGPTLLGLVNAWLSYKSKKQSVKNGEALEVVHQATNVMKDRLIEQARVSGHAAGVTAGVAQQKAETEVETTHILK